MAGDWTYEAKQGDRNRGRSLHQQSGHPLLSFSSEPFWARETRKIGAVGGRFERWPTEPGAVSYGGDMQGCFCVCALRFHTLTQACTHALTHCQCVYLDPVRQFIISHCYKNPLLTNRCSARTADGGGDNAKSPCRTNMGAKRCCATRQLSQQARHTSAGLYQIRLALVNVNTGPWFHPAANKQPF